MLRFRKLHAIKYLYLYYQTNGVWVHIQLNGPLSRQKPVFSGKRVQLRNRSPKDPKLKYLCETESLCNRKILAHCHSVTGRFCWYSM